MPWILDACLVSFPASAEVCDKAGEGLLFGELLFWGTVLLSAWAMIVHRSMVAACLLVLALPAPLLLTLLEGNIDADPFVRGMIREGCKLPHDEELKQNLVYAALAPVAMAFPFLADRLWPRRATSP